MPAAAAQIESPDEPEARYSTKRDLVSVGSKGHLTETCDEDRPPLVTHVATTTAPATDVEQLARIHQGLARTDRLPARYLVDGGHSRARNLVTSRTTYQVDVIGPIDEDRQWQAKAETGFDVAHFPVGWDAQVVTCPQNRPSARWYTTQTARGEMIHVGFAPADCTPARRDRSAPAPRLSPAASHCNRRSSTR